MKLKSVIACLLFVAFCMSAPAMAEDKANLNSATESELAAALGEDLAKKIVEYREDIGDFANYDELKEIEGMTEGKIKEISDHFQIEGVSGVDCNC